MFFSLRVLFSALLLLISAVLSGMASAEIRPIEVMESSSIESRFLYWENNDSQADIDEVLQIPSALWKSSDAGKETLGINASTYWLRFSVKNESDQNHSLIAELGYAQLDDVTFYIFSDGEKVREFVTGDSKAFYPRDVDHPNMLMRFELTPRQVKTIYVRVQTSGSMILPLQIWHENEFFEAAAKKEKLHFFYYGAMTFMILINLAIFLTLREKVYLYYAVAVAGYLMFFGSINGCLASTILSGPRQL